MLTDPELLFSRHSESPGVFSWPTTIYRLSDHRDRSEIGRLSIRFNKATYTSARTGEELRLRRNFWGTAWLEEGDADKRFVKISIGFKHTATFADEERFRMTVKRRWRLFAKKADDEATHRAVFYRDETEVMSLENLRALPSFGNEATAPMEGPIRTTLTEERTVAGLLLLFQTYLTTSRNATFAAG